MKKWLILIYLFFVTVNCVYAEQSIDGNALGGSGATFPQPLYEKYFEVYNQMSGIKISYKPCGSGTGIKELLERTVDFAGSDALLSEREMKKAGAHVLHLPTCIGAVVITYNLPDNPALKFTPDLIADIFLGKITRWSDPRIAAVNPEVKFPDTNIVVVHRSDGSGTTFIFSDYLSKVSKDWAFKIGADKSLKWPAGIGVEKNSGVAEYIKKISGSIGYVELSYAEENNIPTGLIKNRAGQFIKPSMQSASLAARIDLPADTKLYITDTAATGGYPISSFTWIIFYQEQCYNNRSQKRALNLARFLWWITHEGQKYNSMMRYAPLPDAAVKKAEAIIQSMTCEGKQLFNR